MDSFIYSFLPRAFPEHLFWEGSGRELENKPSSHGLRFPPGNQDRQGSVEEPSQQNAFVITEGTDDGCTVRGGTVPQWQAGELEEPVPAQSKKREHQNKGYQCCSPNPGWMLPGESLVPVPAFKDSRSWSLLPASNHGCKKRLQLKALRESPVCARGGLPSFPPFAPLGPSLIDSATYTQGGLHPQIIGPHVNCLWKHARDTS